MTLLKDGFMKKILGFLALVLVLAACSSPNLAPIEPQAFTISYPLSNVLPEARIGVAYGVPLSTSGGTWPVTWTIVSGKLPSGLTIIKNWNNGSSQVYGTPTQTQTATFTVRAKDKNGLTATRTFTLKVTLPLPITITNVDSVMPTGLVNTYYESYVLASGGVMPYTWSISAGQLPPGLVMGAGTIYGTPTTKGNYVFTARVTDSKGSQGTKQFSITIN